MSTVLIINPDESQGRYEVLDVRDFVLDRIPGLPVLIPNWREHGGRACQVWYGHGAGALNLDASAMYLLACAPNMAEAADYYLFGPVAIVWE